MMIIRSASMAGGSFPMLYENESINRMPACFPPDWDRKSHPRDHILRAGAACAHLPKVYVDQENPPLDVYAHKDGQPDTATRRLATEMHMQWLSTFRETYPGQIGFYGVQARRIEPGRARFLNLHQDYVSELEAKEHAHDLAVKPLLDHVDFLCLVSYTDWPFLATLPVKDQQEVTRQIYAQKVAGANYHWPGQPKEWFVSIHDGRLVWRLKELRSYAMQVNVWGAPDRPFSSYELGVMSGFGA